MVESASGWIVLTTVLASNCAFGGNGQVLLLDGEEPADYTAIDPDYFNGENTRPSPGNSCSTFGRLQIRHQSAPGVVVYDFEDTHAQIAITWGASLPSYPIAATISGIEQEVPYTVIFSNPHLDEFGRYALDWVLTRHPIVGGGGTDADDDPPIILGP